MEPSDQLIEQLRREEIEDVRRQKVAQKFWAGAELFGYACEISKAGIPSQNPTFTEEQVMQELRRRLVLAEKLEERLARLGAT